MPGRTFRSRAGVVRRRASLAAAVATAPLGSADLALFHQLLPPPTGGGSQFLRALVSELERRGLRVELNRLSRRTTACLFNSFNFDPVRLRRLARDSSCRMVHRVDGPIAAYRGGDDGTDALVAGLNAELADATVLQSQYSLDESRRRGLEFRDVSVVPNAVDPAIFHPPARRRASGPRLRLITTSWSDNPRKGGATYRWLSEHLDHDRFEYTFVGRSSEPLPGVRIVPPLPSGDVAELLREHDVFVTASLNEAHSNSLLEALACGLPALYVESGSNGELVKGAGIGFGSTDDLLPALERIADELDDRRGRIVVPSLAEVADRYLAVLGLAGAGRG